LTFLVNFRKSRHCKQKIDKGQNSKNPYFPKWFVFLSAETLANSFNLIYDLSLTPTITSNLSSNQGRLQKNLQGVGATKKRPKNNTIKPFPEGGRRQRKKDRKIAKKHRKLSLFSLYLLYLQGCGSSRIFFASVSSSS